MKIKLLEQREDFQTVFEKSIKSFVARQTKHNVLEQELVDLRYNSHLNLIFPSRLPTTELLTLVQDYRHSKSVIAQLGQRMYICLALSHRVRRLFCPKLSAITSLPIDMRNTVFLPGIHSFRMIDVVTDKCIVIPKKGVNAMFLDAEVKGRCDMPLAPRVLEHSAEHQILVEERIKGISIDRVKDSEKRRQAYTVVKESLSERYCESRTKMKVFDYLRRLGASLSSALDVLRPVISTDTAESVIQLQLDILRAVDPFYAFTIELSYTHGDLQDGNIIVGADSEVWIIDWEYSGIRSMFYDAIVWACKTRRNDSVSDRLSQAVADVRQGRELYSWTGRVISEDKEFYFLIFILEDLLSLFNEVSAEYVRHQDELIRERLEGFKVFFRRNYEVD